MRYIVPVPAGKHCRFRPKGECHIFSRTIHNHFNEFPRYILFSDLGTMSGDTILQKVKKSKKVQSKEKPADAEDATTVDVNEIPTEDIRELL